MRHGLTDDKTIAEITRRLEVIRIQLEDRTLRPLLLAKIRKACK